MGPVALVDVHDEHGHVHQRLRLTGAGSQCCIGRSLDCDIIIDDAFAAPRHTLLVVQQDGRLLVRDLDSRNGTRVEGRRLDGGEELIITAGELVIGRTVVRVGPPIIEPEED